jgi:hypothetical protein
MAKFVMYNGDIVVVLQLLETFCMIYRGARLNLRGTKLDIDDFRLNMETIKSNVLP